ncbi:MAG: hypothetical protein WC694_01240 [Candidatus Paceibacterota bacterium]|jgi:hypothetical protein
MSSRFICENNKYKIGGEKEDTIYLPVSFSNLPEEIKVQEQTLYLFNSFHVSLIYIGKIIEKYNITIPDFLNKIENDFCEFIKTNNVEVVRYNNEFKFVARNDKKTVVVMCEVSNLNKFFDLINQKYELPLKYMPTHVTLYGNLKNKPGIWLMNEDDIKNFTIPIENPIGRLL